MKRENVSSGEFYHLVIRGNHGTSIFRDDIDKARMLFILLYFQSPLSVPHVSRYINGKRAKQINQQVTLTDRMNGDTDIFGVERVLVDRMIRERFVELVAFAMMTNHIHMIVFNKTEQGISRYMQRALNAYSKYFNTKYELVGHVLQGPYTAVHVASNIQLLYLSAYVHRNPREIRGWKGREERYPWSSYFDYVFGNRWGNLLVPNSVLDQYASVQDYKKYCVESSRAKSFEHEIG